MPRLRVSTRYSRNYKKQTKQIKQAVCEREAVFLQNPFDSRLDTHKLHGKDRECWSYSVTYKIRIKFIFVKPDEVLYLNIGPHDDVY